MRGGIGVRPATSSRFDLKHNDGGGDPAVFLAVLSDGSGKKLDLAEAPTAFGDFYYRDVPWDQVLADVANRYGMMANVESDTIRLRPR